MLISKFDLYKGEWLELVFKNRNHQYGAYQLRQTHNDLMTRTLSAVFITAAIFGTVVTVIAHSKPPVAAPEVFKRTEIHLDPDKVFEVKKPKEIQKPKTQPAAAAPKATVAVPTQIYVSMKAEVDEKAEEPKALIENVAVGHEEVKGPATGVLNAAPSGQGNTNATGTGGGDDNGMGVTDFSTVEVMPEPIGGMTAWNKFLQKNMRYPQIASENHVSGKSFMSFIIEKDGSLSNITVLRKGGNGFDEEATRVLKLAKAWKPGLQNGQPVRVRYVIPINFQLSDQD